MIITNRINFNDIKIIEYIGKASLPIYFTGEEILHILINKKYICYKIEVNTDIIGFAICKIYDERLHIMSIAIDEKFRKKGYATHLINELKSLNYNKISLYVLESNTSAIKFYEKNNFSLVKIMKEYYTTLNNADAYYYEFKQT